MALRCTLGFHVWGCVATTEPWVYDSFTRAEEDVSLKEHVQFGSRECTRCPRIEELYRTASTGGLFSPAFTPKFGRWRKLTPANKARFLSADEMLVGNDGRTARIIQSTLPEDALRFTQSNNEQGS